MRTGSGNSNGRSGSGVDLALPVTVGRDHIRGRVDAPITLVEYGDFQCPFCRAAVVEVEQVREALGDALRLVYRHFPLTNVHPYAWGAAEAAEAAGAQGRFWQMHDLLFADQEHLAPPDLLAKAAILGLDIDAFERELVERAYAERVEEDYLSGIRSGVRGTPTFFANGIRYAGPFDAANLLALVEQLARR
jgi:protein-disulfide isomerase